MGALTIIYLSGCILSLGYGILIHDKVNPREFVILVLLSTLSLLSLFALFLGHGFNIVNKSEREYQYSVNINYIPLKLFEEKKIIPGIETTLDTTRYELADSRGVSAGKLFSTLKLYIINDYKLLQSNHSCNSSPKSFIDNSPQLPKP